MSNSTTGPHTCIQCNTTYMAERSCRCGANASLRDNRIGSRGFGSLNPHDRTAIAQKGGQAAHQKGTAHEWTSAEAREAGRKGLLKRLENYRRNGEGATTDSGNMNYPPA